MRSLNVTEAELLNDLVAEFGTAGVMLQVARLRDEQAEGFEMEAQAGNADSAIEARLCRDNARLIRVMAEKLGAVDDGECGFIPPAGNGSDRAARAGSVGDWRSAIAHAGKICRQAVARVRHWHNAA